MEHINSIIGGDIPRKNTTFITLNGDICVENMTLYNLKDKILEWESNKDNIDPIHFMNQYFSLSFITYKELVMFVENILHLNDQDLTTVLYNLIGDKEYKIEVYKMLFYIWHGILTNLNENVADIKYDDQEPVKSVKQLIDIPIKNTVVDEMYVEILNNLEELTNNISDVSVYEYNFNKTKEALKADLIVDDVKHAAVKSIDVLFELFKKIYPTIYDRYEKDLNNLKKIDKISRLLSTIV